MSAAEWTVVIISSAIGVLIVLIYDKAVRR